MPKPMMPFHEYMDRPGGRCADNCDQAVSHEGLHDWEAEVEWEAVQLYARWRVYETVQTVVATFDTYEEASDFIAAKEAEQASGSDDSGTPP